MGCFVGKLRRWSLRCWIGLRSCEVELVGLWVDGWMDEFNSIHFMIWYDMVWYWGGIYLKKTQKIKNMLARSYA